MDQSLFTKYKFASKLTTTAVQRINPCYEIAKLFCEELNKTAGQEYVTKAGKKGISDTYENTRVQAELKKIGLTTVKIVDDKEKVVLCEHKCNGFFAQCEASSIGFNMYYGWKLKEARKKIK